VNSSGIDVKSAKILNLATPSSSTDGANKSYVDSSITAIKLSSLQPPITDVSMNSKKITNLATPLNSGDAINLSYYNANLLDKYIHEKRWHDGIYRQCIDEQ